MQTTYEYLVNNEFTIFAVNKQAARIEAELCCEKMGVRFVSVEFYEGDE